jgi:SAF domain
VSPPARRVPTPSWLDVRLVLGVALVLGSVLVGARVVSAARHMSSALVARRALASGTVLSAGDVSFEQVRLPDPSAVYADAESDVVGKRLGEPLSAGQLVPLAALTPEPAETTVVVPFDAASAPDLHKGDRIEVWLSTAQCASVVLLADVTVQGVHTDSHGFGTGTGAQDVVISLAPELAERVVQALALADVQLRAGIRTGAPPPAAGGQPQLPDLAACASRP